MESRGKQKNSIPHSVNANVVIRWWREGTEGEGESPTGIWGAGMGQKGRPSTHWGLIGTPDMLVTSGALDGPAGGEGGGTIPLLAPFQESKQIQTQKWICIR